MGVYDQDNLPITISTLIERTINDDEVNADEAILHHSEGVDLIPYLMIQIAHIIRQLLEKGSKNIKEMELKINEISHQLKKTLISTITNLTVNNKIQLRFD